MARVQIKLRTRVRVRVEGLWVGSEGPLGYRPAYNQKWLYAGPSCI